MTKKLKEEDRAAVDMLLDRTASASAHGFTTAVRANGRVRAASSVLHALDAMPAAEPPADLVERTMRRIDRAVATMPEQTESHAPYVNRHHPLM